MYFLATMFSFLHKVLITISLLAMISFDLLAQEEDVKGGRYRHRYHYFELGREALETEKYDEAIEHFGEALKYDPYHTESYFLRAMANENIGDTNAALTDYNVIIYMSPDHVEALFSRGLLYYHMGKYDFAEKDFINLLNAPKGETNAIFFKFSNYESGATGVLTMEARDAEVYNYLGLARTRLKNYNKAIIDFRLAIKLNPTDPNFFINRGLALEEMGKVEKAKEDFNRALQIDPGNTLANYNLLRLSDDIESIDLYTDLINEDPEFAEPYAQRGLALYNSGKYRRALQDYDKAITLNDKDHENFLNRGLIKDKLRDLHGAFRDFSAAINLKSDYAKAYLNRGNVLTKQRKFKEAIEDYNRSILLDPVNPTSFYNRGVAKYNLGHLDACDDVTRAYELGMESAKKAVNTMCVE